MLPDNLQKPHLSYVVPKNLEVTQLATKLPILCGIHMFISVITKPTSGPILSYMKAVPTPTPHFFITYSNILLSCMLAPPK